MKNRIREKLRIAPEDELKHRGDTDPYASINSRSDHSPQLGDSRLRNDLLSTRGDLKVVNNESLPDASDTANEQIDQGSQKTTDADTLTMPVIHVVQVTNLKINAQHVDDKEGHIPILRRLIKSTGIYALASVANPLTTLVLAPFLTYHLSPSDYGILTIINISISLTAGITQLGLASAFFRAYGYDFTARQDKLDVVATATTLLCLTSTCVAVAGALMSSAIASILFGQSRAGSYIILAGVVVLLQNLTIPAMAWLRVESRALSYSLLTFVNVLVTLVATIFLTGILHWGVSGVIIANGCGYACIVLCTLPIIVLRAGIKIRTDILRNLLSFGLPLVLNFASYWILQLSDRYLLGLFASLAETARYAVAYNLGSAISVVIMGPFALAWPATVFTIAKREDATRVFKLVFRWFGLFLLFSAFCLSLVGVWFLNWLFPVAYHSTAFVIPIVATSIAFYGVYYIFKSGLDIKRKTWIISIYTTSAALVNIALNLFLIPHYGAMGAAISTLIAYTVLATIAYIVNRRIYPISFEIGIFITALLIGIALYMGSDLLAQARSIYLAWGIRIGALSLYGIFLVVLGKFLIRKH